VLLVLYRLRFAARARWQLAMQAQADQSGFLEEHLSATEDVRASGATSYALRRFGEHAHNLLVLRRRASILDGAVGGGDRRLVGFAMHAQRCSGSVTHTSALLPILGAQ
jgi:hypothetical protein